MITANLNSPLHAIHCLLQGFKLMTTPEFRHFILAPLLINLVLYGIALAVGVHYFGVFMQHVIPQWLEFIAWLLWPVFGLGFLLIIYFSFTLLANVIASPFYGFLAEKAILHVEGVIEADNTAPLPRAIFASITSSLGRLGYFLLRAVPLLILFLIPGINLIAPFVWMGFSAWVVGQEYMAYPLEVKGHDFARQREVVKGMRLGLLTYGGLVMLGLAIPLLNIFMPPAAVIGAALYQKGHERHDLTTNPQR